MLNRGSVLLAAIRSIVLRDTPAFSAIVVHSFLRELSDVMIFCIFMMDNTIRHYCLICQDPNVLVFAG